VIATARNVADLEDRVKADKIPNTHVVQADLTSADSLKAAAKSTSSLINGSIDHLLINGAFLSSTGGLNPTDFADKPELFLEELRKSDEANIAGPLFTINAFLPLLRAGKEKRVTYISSGVADLPETIETRVANSVPYCTSKAGGNIVIAKFAAELQDEGFTFLSIAPGAVATDTLMNTLNCKLGHSFPSSCRDLAMLCRGSNLHSFLYLKDSAVILMRIP
jgi:NAD(P)-dependent dehydrogenase (short-subunit alcohol dehydrogenase family)